MLPRPRQLSALLIASCLALVACSDDEDPTARPQPTTTAPSTSTTTTSPEQADEAALRQLAEDWYAQIGATFASGASVDEAVDYLVDPYLAQFEQQVRDFRGMGNQTEVSDQSSQTIESVEVDGDSGLVTECIVNANVLRGPDGRVLNDDVVATRVETVATRATGGWRFSERTALGEVEAAACVG